MDKFFITTPIYYVNDSPHIGHAYTTFVCDSVARFWRLLGREVFFLSGTDEHGQKIENAAKAHNKSPKEYTDEVSARFLNLWREFEISFNHFIRTTDEYHKQSVKAAFLKMFEKGDIYLGEYEGLYCVSCESFFTPTQAPNNRCPDCGKELSKVKEESYFFALSKYQQKLLDFYKAHPDFILPTFRANEVIRFVENGLEDLSISRTSFKWGVELPEQITQKSAKKHISYVWLDALLNYISALGYENTQPNKLDFWPGVHIVGKDILRFHAIFWPAFLMSLDLPAPRHIAAHGWWMVNGEKMSKSLGNVISPKIAADVVGVEVFRYFCLREMAFGSDGDFSTNALVERTNAELADDLGNLVSRLQGMCEKYFKSAINVEQDALVSDFSEILAQSTEIFKTLPSFIEQFAPHRYLEELWKVFRLCNAAIADFAPWAAMKKGENARCELFLCAVCNVLVRGAIMLSPFMPRSAEAILAIFGLRADFENYKKFVLEQNLLLNFKLNSNSMLFPKLEKEPVINALLGQKIDSIKNIESKSIESKKAQSHAPLIESSEISIDDFAKCDIRVGTILSAEKMPKSEKLLKLQVDLGEEKPRQILSGIAAFYECSELVGEQVCVLCNLPPRKMLGEQSFGMILASKDESGLCIISPQKKRQNGSKIS